MCTETAKEKLKKVSKPSPIHKKMQDCKGALFQHPIPATKDQKERYNNMHCRVVVLHGLAN